MRISRRVFAGFFVFILALSATTHQTYAASSLNYYTESDFYLNAAANEGRTIIADIFGDGDNDLILFGDDNSGSISIFFHGNVPTTGDTLSTSVTGYNVKFTNLGSFVDYPTNSLITGDVDNDGTSDLIVFTSGALYAFRADDLATYVNQTNQSINVATTPTAYMFKLYKSGLHIRVEDGRSYYVEDVSGDGNNDILVGDDSNDIYYLNNSIFAGSSNGTAIDLGTDTNYSVKITTSGTLFGDGNGFTVGDFTNDGLADLVALTDNLGRGGIYIVLGSYLSSIAGTGNTFSINTPANITKRFQGTVGNDFYENYTSLLVEDVTGDGDNDLLVGTGTAGPSGNGAVYVFSNELLSTLEGTTGGDGLMSDTTQYSFRITGTSNVVTYAVNQNIHAADINENGINDLVIGDDHNSAGCTNCGKAFVILDNLLSTMAASSSPSNSFPLTTSSNFSLTLQGAQNGDTLSDTGNRGNGGIALRDFDTDGYSDLIITSYNSGVTVYLSARFSALGTTTGTTWLVSDNTNVDRYYTGGFDCNTCQMYVGDVSGNGANDFAVANNGESFLFIGGSTIASLDATLAVEMQTGGADPETAPQGGSKGVIITKSSNPVALVTTNFSSTIETLDWSSITANTDTTAGKSVVTGIGSADGASATHSLYVKKLDGAIGVYVCPSATTLNDISDACSGGYQLNEGDSGLSSVTIDSVAYWKIDNLTGTGAQNVMDSDNPTGSISINSGASATSSQSVTLTISATDGSSSVTNMKISEDSSFTGISWEAYATSKAFTLSAGDGTKTVYIKFKDGANNESGNYMDTIVLDTAGPSKLKIGLKKDDLFEVGKADLEVKTQKFKLYLDIFDKSSSSAKIKVSEHKDFKGATWKDYDGDVTIKLSDKPGKKHLYFLVKDSLDQQSDTYKQLVKYDPMFKESIMSDDDDRIAKNHENLVDGDATLKKIGTIDYDPTHQNYFYTENYIKLSGDADGPTPITIDDTSYTTQHDAATNSWSYSTTLDNGVHKISVGKYNITLTIDPTGATFPEELKQVLGISDIKEDTPSSNTAPSISPTPVIPQQPQTQQQDTTVQGKKSFWQKLKDIF